MRTLFTVLHLIVTVLLIVIVLLQEGKDPGMRGISGSAPDMGDSFFSKNTGRTKAAFMSKVTCALAILFLITTLVLVIL
ncbi:MAG: preprotein translocase subunit SecG [Clostridia bacterium]|nr:preprotein translocase subunit SecG [Clostridia bacterium]